MVLIRLNRFASLSEPVFFTCKNQLLLLWYHFVPQVCFDISARCYKTLPMLNSTEYKIYQAHKC